MNGLFKKLNQSKIFKDLTPEEFSWVLYDVGNSAFTMLACSLVPVWFSNLVLATGANQLTATSMWGYVQAGVTVILVIVGPALGAIADHKDTRKILFQTAVFVGVTMCIITGFAWNWVIFTIMYMLTRLFYKLLPVQILIVAVAAINSIVDGTVAGRCIDSSTVGVVGLYFSFVNVATF